MVEAPCTDACTLLTQWLCARSPQHSYSSLEDELNLFSADIFQGPYPEDSKAAWLTNRAIVKGTKYKIRETNKKKVSCLGRIMDLPLCVFSHFECLCREIISVLSAEGLCTSDEYIQSPGLLISRCLVFR